MLAVGISCSWSIDLACMRRKKLIVTTHPRGSRHMCVQLGESLVRTLRASPLVSPTRPRRPYFSSEWQKTVQSRPWILDFARIWAFIHPASPDQPWPSGARSGTPDETNWRETAENIHARSRGSCGPDLSARVGGHRRHRLVFRASSSPHASSSARCKGCRRWPASHTARRVNATAAI
jgi:hypothetical protein